MTELNCPACGTAVNASMKFCQSCGTPLEGLVEKTGTASTVHPSAPSACPHCGAPATAPNQKFCASCGGAMGAETPAALSQPVVAPPSAGASLAPSAGVASVASAGATTGQMKADMAQMRSRFDDFMGASVDVSTVGRGFDPQSIVLNGDNDPRLVEAFAFFNKVYLASEETPTVEAEETLAPRAEPEETRPQAKERRDFSARKGGFAYGELITKLSPSAAPSVLMIEEVRGKALEKQSKDREKRKAALNA